MYRVGADLRVYATARARSLHDSVRIFSNGDGRPSKKAGLTSLKKERSAPTFLFRSEKSII